MSTSASVTPESHPTKTAPWWEIVIIIALYLIIGFIIPSLKQILAVPLIAYMIVEGLLRHHTWADFGFNLRSIPSGLFKTLGWILLVGIGTQALYAIGAKLFLPEVFTHLIARIPINISAISVSLLITLAIATFLEEVIFRGLFQNRLNMLLNPTVAIVVTSLVFAVAHFSAGPAIVVIFDLVGVFIDSVIYGIIFQHSRNVFVSWIAHYLADIVGIILIMLLK
jgi:membrane protease YdiL (CAAX protease family)